jgi:hypothetical protein
MQTNIPCTCGDAARSDCTGNLSATEIKMAEMDPSRTAQEYHEIINLFVDAFDLIEEGK